MNIVIADTNALLRIFDQSMERHTEHVKALASAEHLVISPLVLTELDYLLTRRGGTAQAIRSLEFINRQVSLRRFSIPDITPQLSAAIAVADGYRDADGGKGIGLVDATNVALAAAYNTNLMLTEDRHFRMVRPLTGHDAFRLLPDDL